MTFEEFISKHGPEIHTIQALLGKRLSDNPVTLVQQLTEIESWASRLTTILAHGNSFLDEAEYQELQAIDKDKKALEREVELRARVVKQRRFRDILQGCADSVKHKISLGQSIMRANNSESQKFGT